MTDSMNQKTYEICSLQKQVIETDMYRKQLDEEKKLNNEKVGLELKYKISTLLIEKFVISCEQGALTKFFIQKF